MPSSEASDNAISLHKLWGASLLVTVKSIRNMTPCQKTLQDDVREKLAPVMHKFPGVCQVNEEEQSLENHADHDLIRSLL